MASSGTDRTARRPRRAGVRLVLLWAVTVTIIVSVVVFAAMRSVPYADRGLYPGIGQARGPETKIPAGESPRAAPRLADEPPAMDQLHASIHRILAARTNLRIGVVLADAQTGELHSYGDVSPYLAASTAKVLTAVAYYRLVETGAATLEDPIGDVTAAFQLRALINTSNEDSWLLLMNAIGFSGLIDYAASIGIMYNPELNLLTPAEMAGLLLRLYSGDLLNAEHTAELLGHMQETNNEDLIPAAVPSNVAVHHKYGQVDGHVHDAAVLASGDTAYALVIYTSAEPGGGTADQIGVIHEVTSTICGVLFAS